MARMTQYAPPPIALLVHDGELADLRVLLGDLGTTCTERREMLEREDRAGHWDVVIATPRRMLELHLDPQAVPPTRIAILDHDSRTLRNTLRRAGIQLIVRRPVHPAALRALILHALYRGPEKRRTPRVSVGAPVLFRLGWRKRPAILADLSLGGCRLLTGQRAERGKGFTLYVPTSVSGKKAFSVNARVLESGHIQAGTSGSWFLAARFEKVRQRQLQLLEASVHAHASGPASYAGAGQVRDADPADSTPTPQAIQAPLQPVLVQERESEPQAPEPQILTPSDEAGRVLMGHDISVGGMRVSPNPLLALGAKLQLAVHVGNRDVPLVVRARVHRDEGEHGMVLRFYEHTDEVSRYLNEMMDQLPLVDAGEDGQGYLVTEILETA